MLPPTRLPAFLAAPPSCSLEGSAEYKAWQRAKKVEAAREAMKGLPLLVWLFIAAVAVAGGVGVWKATRIPAPGGSVHSPENSALTAVDFDSMAAEAWQLEEAALAAAAGIYDEPTLVERGVEGDPDNAGMHAVPAAAAQEAAGTADLATEPTVEGLQAQLLASQEDKAALAAALAAAHDETRRVAAALQASQAEADSQRAALDHARDQLGAAQAAVEAARHSADDSSQLRQEVVRLQLELEEALAARQQAEAQASAAAEAQAEAGEAVALELREARAAQHAAEETAATVAAELDAVRQALAERDVALQAATQAGEAAQREAAAARAIAAEVEAARADKAEAEAAAVAASAARQNAEAAAAAAQESAAALRAELQQLAEAREVDAAEADSAACSAEHAWQQLWQRRPEVVGTAAAAAACTLLAAVVLTAVVVKRRSKGRAAAFDSKQLARLQRQLEQAQQENDAKVAAFKKAQAAADKARQWQTAAAQLAAATAEAPLHGRTPLAARSPNKAAGVATGSAAAAPLVLPAGKADSPAAWLDLLQQRWAALSGAASSAGAVADEAMKEQAWGQEKVSPQ